MYVCSQSVEETFLYRNRVLANKEKGMEIVISIVLVGRKWDRDHISHL